MSHKVNLTERDIRGLSRHLHAVYSQFPLEWCEDIVAETILSMLRYGYTVDFSNSMILSFRRANAEYKREVRKREADETFTDAQRDSENTDGYYVDYIAKVTDLDVKERAIRVFVDHYLNGLTYRQIQKKHSIKKSTVESHIRIVLKRLRSRYA